MRRRFIWVMDDASASEPPSLRSRRPRPLATRLARCSRTPAVSRTRSREHCARPCRNACARRRRRRSARSHVPAPVRPLDAGGVALDVRRRGAAAHSRRRNRRRAAARRSSRHGRWAEAGGSWLASAADWALMLTGTLRCAGTTSRCEQLEARSLARLGEPVVRGRGAPGDAHPRRAVRARRDDRGSGGARRGERPPTASPTTCSAKRRAPPRMRARYLEPYCARDRRLRAPDGVSVKLSALHPALRGSEACADLRRARCRARAARCACRRSAVGCTIDAEESERLELTLDLSRRIDRTLRRPGRCRPTRSAPSRSATGWSSSAAARERRIADPPRERRLLGRRGEARAAARHAGLPGLHAQGGDRCLLRRLRDRAALGAGRDLSGLRDAQLPHAWRRSCELGGKQGSSNFRSCSAWATRSTTSCSPTIGTSQCRIYAPVGSFTDLLPYLVRRLLENGANTSFVHQIADPTVPLECPGRRSRWRPSRTSPIRAFACREPLPGPQELARPRSVALRRASTPQGARCVADGPLPPVRSRPRAQELDFQRSRAPGRRSSPGRARPRARARRRCSSATADRLERAHGRAWFRSSCARAGRTYARRGVRSARGRRLLPLLRPAGEAAVRRAASLAWPGRRANRPRTARPRRRSPASAPGTSRSPSSPARSPRRSPPATPSSPSPPSRRRCIAHARGRRCCTRPASRRTSLHLLPSATATHRRAAGRRSAHRRRRLHRLDRDRAGDQPGARRARRADRAAHRRDRRRQRHARRLLGAAGAGGRRRDRLGLPERRPALLGAAHPASSTPATRRRDARAAARRASPSSRSAIPSSPTPTSGPVIDARRARCARARTSERLGKTRS